MEALAFLRGPAGYIALHKPIIVVGRSADCDISLIPSPSPVIMLRSFWRGLGIAL